MYETAVAAAGWDKHRKTVVDVCVCWGEFFNSNAAHINRAPH